MALATDIAAELERLAAAAGGILAPQAVVEAARDPKSPMHSRFTWDDSHAAELYRLEEARRLIRVHVTIRHVGEAPVPVWVSLEKDRKSDIGYRKLLDVMADEDLRGHLLNQARDEMRRFTAKYEAIKALEPVIAAMRKVM